MSADAFALYKDLLEASRAGRIGRLWIDANRITLERAKGAEPERISHKAARALLVELAATPKPKTAPRPNPREPWEVRRREYLGNHRGAA